MHVEEFIDPNMLSLTLLEMVQWDLYMHISKDNHIDEFKVIWKIGGCNYSLKIVKAAVSIESQVMLTAARQSRRHCSFQRYRLNGVYLTENDTSQSCCEHPLKNLKVTLLVFIVIIITKLDPDRQRSLNAF